MSDEIPTPPAEIVEHAAAFVSWLNSKGIDPTATPEAAVVVLHETFLREWREFLSDDRRARRAARPKRQAAKGEFKRATPSIGIPAKPSLFAGLRRLNSRNFKPIQEHKFDPSRIGEMRVYHAADATEAQKAAAMRGEVSPGGGIVGQG